MIECRNLCVTFRHANGTVINALRNLSVDIADSEFIAVLGPNGSGKSTFALCLAGLQPISSGAVTIDGVGIDELISTRKICDLTGIVFQNPDDQLITNFTEREIAFALENRSIPRQEMEKRVEEMLYRFNIHDLKNRSPNQISGGQKQKLALASVMVAGPKYLLLDEPTSYLDIDDRRMILRLLRTEFQTREHKGFAVIFITQFPREAFVSSRVLVLDGGQIVADDTPENLFDLKHDLLQEIGLEIPVEYRLRQAAPGIHIPSALFDFL